MLQTRRAGFRAIQCFRTRPQRRSESSHSSSSSSGSHSNVHDAHHASPVNEHFGRNFYLTLAAIPVSLAFYSFTTSDPTAPPLFTRIINAYSDYKDEWALRNTLHTHAIEQAAFDRNLFQNETGAPRLVDLRFPEVFNTGSPYNVPPGHAVNLDALIEHYKEKNRKMVERVANKTERQKLAAM